MDIAVKDSAVKEGMDSKFRYVLVVAQRAEQLIRGARTKMEGPGEKPVRLAQDEIERGMIDWGYGEAPETEEAAAAEEASGETETAAEDAAAETETETAGADVH